MIQGIIPLPWTELVGRDRERQLLRRLLGRARLVTVVGLCGVGKSRLARQVVEDLRPAFEGEVWYVACESLESAAQISPILGGTPDPAHPPAEAATPLPLPPDRRALLVLDSVEALLDNGLLDLLPQWLASSPGLTVLLTSLTATGLEGEHLFSLRPMVPPIEAESAGAGSIAVWRDVEAIRLFEARAQQRDCEWQLTSENLPTVIALCREMDWLPLGIELVAGQLSPWTVEQLLVQIQERGQQLDLTASGRAERHTSLRRAIGWTWSLLPSEERDLVATLAAWGGQAFEEALEPLTGGGQATQVAASLFRKGVLQKEERAGRLRYCLPQTIASFVREQQPARPLDMARVAAFSLAMACREGERLRIPGAAGAVEALRLEMPQLERCWQWAREQNDGPLLRAFAVALRYPLIHDLNLPAAAEELVAAALDHLSEAQAEEALWLLWVAGAAAARLGSVEVGAARLRQCLEAGAPERVRALALREVGWIYLQQGQPLAARDSLQQSVVLLEQLGHEEETAWARRALAAAYERLGDRAGAERTLEEAWLQFRELGLPTGQAGVCVDLARLAADQGQWAIAEARGQEGARHYQCLGHAAGIGAALLQLARVRVSQRDLDQARQLYHEALARLRAAGAAAEICQALLQAAAETHSRVWPIEPTRAYRECIELSRERGMRSLLAHALRGLAQAYADEGRVNRALCLAQEAVEVARETTEMPLIQACLDLYQRVQQSPEDPDLAALASRTTAPGLLHVQSVTILERESDATARPEPVALRAQTFRVRANNWPPTGLEPASPRQTAGPMEVRLLGGLTLCWGEQEVPLLDWWAKAKKLFAYLVIHRNRPISRDVLLEEFWPEGDQQRAIHSLQTTLSFVRRSLRSLPGGAALANRLIVARDGNYFFDTEGQCDSDVYRFERCWQEGARLKAAGQLEAAAGQWAVAERLYVGDLLPDFPYEDWCASPRERLRSQFLDLLLDLARYQRQIQKPQEALRTTERMFLIDGCDERAHRMAMRCHVQLGRPVDSLRQYERCCQILERELRVRPSKATRDLHELIRQRMASRSEPPSSDGHGLAAGA